MISSITNWIRTTPLRIEAAKLIAKHGTEADNWIKKDTKLSLYGMGQRCEKDMSVYFSGESNSQLSSPEEIHEWLKNCSYVTRMNRKGLSEKWIHPIEFEKVKKGHCVDFSLYCWRKLCEAGYYSELVFGTRYRDELERQHAWITYTDGGSEYLFEALPIEGRTTIEPIENIKKIYTPWYSVSCKLSCFVYTGYISALNRSNV